MKKNIKKKKYKFSTKNYKQTLMLNKNLRLMKKVIYTQ